MFSQSTISIYFYLDKKVYASRIWNAVPRVGDEIMLNHRDNQKYKTAFSIKRVVWGIEPNYAIRQEVNIEIEIVKESK